MALVFVVLGLALVAGVVSFFVAQQRVRDIRAFAVAHSLSVLGNGWDLGDCEFALFRAGNRRYWRNVLRGQWQALPVTYCDYSYVVSEGRNQSTVSFSNVLGTLGMRIPWVTVMPRSVIGAFAERTVGAPGIRFESIEFNDRFDVHSSDEAFAVELIDAQMIETLLALDRRCHVVFGPEYLMVYEHRRPVAEIGALFDAASTVSARIPALVRSRFGTAPPASDGLGSPPA